MGVIQRQATKSSIISWAGLVLGIFNILFIVPYALEMYGIFMFINGIVMMVSPIITMGMSLGVNKFFNEYDDGTRANRSLLSFGLLATLMGFMMFSLVVYLFREPILDYYATKEPERYQYLIIVFPLILLAGLFNVVEKYISNFQRIVVPTIIKSLIKIVLPVLLVLFWKEEISSWGFLNWLVVFNAFIFVVLLLYLRHLKELDFRWSKSVINTAHLKEMRAFMFNGMLLSTGGVIAGLIDSFMVGSMIDMGESTAIYSIGAVISGVLMMPNTALGAIANPIISKGWKDKDINVIQSLYSKSSLNLFLVGLLLFSGIWVGIDDVFSVMHNGEIIAEAKGVILFLGIARLFSMACGINGNVLYMSPSFKVGTYAILFLAVLNVINNYYFISKYGLVGAAMGTAVSVGLYNFFLTGYLFYKYRLQPFSPKLLTLLAIALLITFLVLKINIGNAYLNLIIKSILVFITYVPIIYFTKQSQDINDLIDKYIRMGLSYVKNRR